MSDNINVLAEIEKLIGQKAFEALAQDVYAELKKRALTDTTYTKDEVNSLVNGLTKLTVQVVAELPPTGQENILYLVPSKKPSEAAKNIKEEYLWIEGKYELIGTTQAVENQIFKGQKTSLEIADSEVISDYFELNSQVVPAKGDIFLITTLVDEKVYELSSYIYDGSDWIAITGNVDASKVIFRKDFTGAGDWDKIGNYTKGKIAAKGLSVEAWVEGMLTKKLQPNNPTQPAISGFSLQGAKTVEAGTKLDSVTLTAASLSAGSYQYGPATGVTAQSWKIDRVTNVSELNTKIADANSGTDNNGGKGFIIGDQGGENVVNSLKYTATATHNEGTIAYDNLGGQSNPPKKIEAGTKTATTSAYTPFRQYFYGGTSDGDSPLNSALIRKLTGSNKAYTKGKFNITVPAGSKRVIIATIGTAVGLTKVVNLSIGNVDVTGTFGSPQTIKVEGAQGYTSVDYKVWVYTPSVPYEKNTDLEITLG